jgi:hypothetical protein
MSTNLHSAWRIACHRLRVTGCPDHDVLRCSPGKLLRMTLFLRSPAAGAGFVGALSGTKLRGIVTTCLGRHRLVSDAGCDQC